MNWKSQGPMVCALGCALGMVACSSDPVADAGDSGAPLDGAPALASQEAPIRSKGCGGKSALASGQQTIEVDGVDRGYALLLPEDYDADKAYPLVFEFHGTGGNGQSQFVLSGLANFMDAIFVAPDGLAGEGLGSFVTQFSETRDVPMFDSIVDHMQDELCVDRGRIFASGMSIGGFWANELACLRGGTLRATAPVAGSLISASCEGRVAVMQIHGEADDTTPYEQALESRTIWSTIGDCDLEDFSEGTDPHCDRYAGCEPSHPLEWCAHAGGHTWPDWASGAIADFFMGLDAVEPRDDTGTFDASAAGAKLKFSLAVPDSFTGPPVHVTAALYAAGSTLLAGAPLKTLKDGLDLSKIESGETAKYEETVLLDTLEPGTYRFIVFVYVTESFPIPTFGTDWVGYRDIEITGDDIVLKEPLELIELPFLLPN